CGHRRPSARTPGTRRAGSFTAPLTCGDSDSLDRTGAREARGGGEAGDGDGRRWAGDYIRAVAGDRHRGYDAGRWERPGGCRATDSVLRRAVRLMLIDDLRSLFLFAGLSDEQLRELIAAGDEVHFENGDVLFQEGEAADFWWVLVEGRVELLRRTRW